MKIKQAFLFEDSHEITIPFANMSKLVAIFIKLQQFFTVQSFCMVHLLL